MTGQGALNALMTRPNDTPQSRAYEVWLQYAKMVACGIGVTQWLINNQWAIQARPDLDWEYHKRTEHYAKYKATQAQLRDQLAFNKQHENDAKLAANVFNDGRPPRKKAKLIVGQPHPSQTKGVMENLGKQFIVQPNSGYAEYFNTIEEAQNRAAALAHSTQGDVVIFQPIKRVAPKRDVETTDISL